MADIARDEQRAYSRFLRDRQPPQQQQTSSDSLNSSRDLFPTQTGTRPKRPAHDPRQSVQQPSVPAPALGSLAQQDPSFSNPAYPPLIPHIGPQNRQIQTATLPPAPPGILKCSTATPATPVVNQDGIETSKATMSSRTPPSYASVTSPPPYSDVNTDPTATPAKAAAAVTNTTDPSVVRRLHEAQPANSSRTPPPQGSSDIELNDNPKSPTVAFQGISPPLATSRTNSASPLGPPPPGPSKDAIPAADTNPVPAQPASAPVPDQVQTAQPVTPGTPAHQQGAAAMPQQVSAAAVASTLMTDKRTVESRRQPERKQQLDIKKLTQMLQAIKAPRLQTTLAKTSKTDSVDLPDHLKTYVDTIIVQFNNINPPHALAAELYPMIYQDQKSRNYFSDYTAASSYLLLILETCFDRDTSTDYSKALGDAADKIKNVMRSTSKDR